MSTIKKLLSSSSVIVLAACTAALAGGPDVYPAAPPEAPIVDYFSGVSLGIQGNFRAAAWENDSFGETVLVQNNVVTNSFGSVAVDDDVSEYTASGGVNGSIGKVFHDKYYLGIYAFGDFGVAKETVTAAGTDLFGDAFLLSSEAEAETEYGVGPKVGYVFGPDRKTMAYLKGGAIWGEIENTTTYTPVSNLGNGAFGNPVTASTEDTELGWMAGLGIERILDAAGRFSVDLEGTYQEFDDIECANFDIATGDPNTAALVTQVSNETTLKEAKVTLGLNYRPAWKI